MNLATPTGFDGDVTKTCVHIGVACLTSVDPRAHLFLFSGDVA